MNPRIAFLATATASALLLVAACGGDGGQAQIGGTADSTQSPPASGTGGSTGGDNASACRSVIGSRSGSTGGNGTSANYTAIDLHSSGYTFTEGWGIVAGQQVGWSHAKIDSRGVNHALLWRGSASSIVDLHPAGFTVSWAFATNGTIQVGSGNPPGKITHALKWSGSAESVVDLDPDSSLASEARAVAGDQIVGHRHGYATMWTDTVVDLNPSGFDGSIAFATDGAQQVGMGGRAEHLPLGSPNSGQHALLWSGTAESAIDLHPVGCLASLARGVSGGQQVGEVLLSSSSNETHAVLWTGSAETIVDLDPSGHGETYALAAAAGRQVGYGAFGGGYHALLWHGTADSMVDLHAFLPPGFYSSQAHGVDALGNVIGSAVAKPSQECPSGCAHAILWVRQ